MTLDVAKARKRDEPVQTRKDATKYHFMGKQLIKRQSVLERIKQHISDSGATNTSYLFEILPNNVQGSLGVFRSAEERFPC